MRRTSYGTDEHGFFTEETAKVFGVPFELIPFKTTGGEGPPPSPPDNEIYAVPEKVEYEISFPVVEGYQDPGIVDVVMAWDRVATITLDPMDIPDSTLVRGLAAADGRLAAYGPGQPVELNLEDWRKQIRPQQVAFDLALALTEQWLKEKGDQIPSHVLFPRMLAFARRYLEQGVEYRGSRAPSDVALSPYYGRALAALFQGLSAKDRAGSAELPLIPSGGAGLRSTADVRFFTGREVWQVEKCHLNAMVGDTKKWEQSAAYTLDRHPGVVAWVKNERLGFHIPYRKAAGIVRAYNADFIVRLDIELNLILEFKGRASDDAKIKEAAARRWVDAVNRDGRFGLWRYEIVYDPAELSKRLDEVCAVKQDRTLEKV